MEVGNKESSDMVSEQNNKSSHPRDSNPWHHLQTITSFDQAIKSEDKFIHFENLDRSFKVINSYTYRNQTSLKNFQMGKEDQIKKNPFKEAQKLENPVSSQSEKVVCLPAFRSILAQEGNIRRPTSQASLKSRSRKTSFSDGDIQHMGTDSTNTHSSSHCHNSAAVSKACGGDSLLNDRGEGTIETLSRFSPTSLLVESLIDQLCKLMERDTTRRKKLYHVICDRLHRMHLIDDTYTIEEFQFMRSHYQRALYQLLAVAKSSTNAPEEKSIILPLPSANINIDMKLSSEQVLDWSRYHNEYQELEHIAKGGFGHVFRVRNRLDGGEYAIKKIYLRYSHIADFLRSLKEVKMLARLNHPNIVSYKAAWLEPLNENTQKARVQRDSQKASLSIFSLNSRLPLPSTSQIVPGDSSDIAFQETSHDIDSQPCTHRIKADDSVYNNELVDNDTQKDSSSPSRKLLSELLTSHSIVFQPPLTSPKSVVESQTITSESDETDTSDTSSDEAIFALSQSSKEHSVPDVENRSPVALRNWAILYVQMQLCQRTLRQWLEERNSSLPAYPLGSNTKEGSVALSLFRKIVRGVEYIHSQGIVHHDIKPSNIFVNENMKEVQVGDFGLSCCLLSRVDHTGTVGDHHGGVGTRIYAAPEQLRGKCTSKSDIYSLGIVLLELLQPFHTDMERSKVIEKLRAGHLPSELASTWPHAARLMSDLLVTSPTARPSACELLKRVEKLLRVNVEQDVGSQLASKDETIRLLKEAVATRDQEIAELRQRLSLLENGSSNVLSDQKKVIHC